MPYENNVIRQGAPVVNEGSEAPIVLSIRFLCRNSMKAIESRTQVTTVYAQLYHKHDVRLPLWFD